MTASTPLLQVQRVSKRFPGVQALERVCLELAAGEVLAVVGENGAGKSTLMKILGGIEQADVGQILLNGKPVTIRTVPDALRLGINLIHQELNLAENLSVAANLFLGREVTRLGWLRFLDQRAMDRETHKRLEPFGLDCSPATRISELTPGQRQLVEIARALALKARVLIMDEPTSSLTQRETDRLFEVVRQLRSQGVAVVHISHRLGEVEQIADRVVVLRDGRNAGELSRGAISHANLVKLMVGRELSQFFQRQHRPVVGQAPRLEVRNLRYSAGPATAVSFALYPGEIVGMSGLVGAGRTELGEALFGIGKQVAGEVKLDGRLVRIRRPQQSIAAGMLLVPEDRRYHGLLLDDTVQRNIGLPNLDQLSLLRLVLNGQEAALAEQMRSRLGIRTPSLQQKVGLLSGGNQQKVVLGKWLARRPSVLILDEPTRGIDVGAKSEIYALMDRLAGDGVAILMISSDLEEILGMSDRVLVMHQGRLAGELPRERLNEQSIMHLATGGSS